MRIRRPPGPDANDDSSEESGLYQLRLTIAKRR